MLKNTQIIPFQDGLLDKETGEIIMDQPDFLIKSADYLDYYDKTHKNVLTDSESPPNLGRESCISGFITGSCSNGHNVAKIIYCGKEYCSECGEKDSPIHQRRKARWYDKIHSLHSVGYLVITVPDHLRKKFLATEEMIEERARIKKETGRKSVPIPNQQLMQKFATSLKRLLCRMGYEKGMYRWHWAGDCHECKDPVTKQSKGCECCDYTGAGKIWKPHLNIILEEAFMNEYDLHKIKNYARKWFNNNMHGKLKEPVVCHYQYTGDPKKKNHILNYVTRATWRHKKNFIVCQSIHDFKGTSRSWGKFDIKGESTSDLMQLVKGICPCCADNDIKVKLKWGTFMGRREMENQIIKATKMYDGGYFRMKDTPPEEIIKPPPKYGLIPE